MHSYEEGNMNDNLINQNRLKNIKDYLKQMIILYKDFHTQIIELLNTIKLVGKDNLNYLQIKLDFNNYYSFLEKENEDKKNREAAEKINKEEERKSLIDKNIDDNKDKLIKQQKRKRYWFISKYDIYFFTKFNFIFKNKFRSNI